VTIDLLEDLDSLNVLIEEQTPERRETGRQQLERLSLLIQRLPDRCRDVVWMRRVEDLPQKVIAKRLEIAEATVENISCAEFRMLTDRTVRSRREHGAHSPSTRPRRPGRAMETKPMPTREDIEQAAGTWIAQRDSGGWSEADAASFQEWLAAGCLGTALRTTAQCRLD